MILGDICSTNTSFDDMLVNGNRVVLVKSHRINSPCHDHMLLLLGFVTLYNLAMLSSREKYEGLACTSSQLPVFIFTLKHGAGSKTAKIVNMTTDVDVVVLVALFSLMAPSKSLLRIVTSLHAPLAPRMLFAS